MSKKKEQNYTEIKKILSDEEIVENFIFRGILSGDDKTEAEDEFRRIRLERLKEMSDSQILQSELIRMNLLIRDYFKQSSFLQEYSFSSQLKNYVSILKKSMKEIATDLNIHKTKLSRIINGRENPNIDLMYRLEKHSGELIPATYWFRLHTKELEEEIKINLDKREIEYKKVTNELNFKKIA